MKIDKEKIEKAMKNKKFVVLLAVAMLVLGILMSYIASAAISTGHESLGNTFGVWSQIFIIIFIGLFVYILFALDKTFIEKMNKKKEKEKVQ